MAYLWMVTVGFLICLGIVGGIWIYFLRSGLDPRDAARIDSPNHDQE